MWCHLLALCCSWCCDWQKSWWSEHCNGVERKKENWCFAQIGNVSALFHMMMHGALFSFPLVLVVLVLVRSVSVYSSIFSTQFLAPFECLWWFFSKCSSTFLNGSHCNLPTKKNICRRSGGFFCACVHLKMLVFFIRSVGLLCTIQVRKRKKIDPLIQK